MNSTFDVLTQGLMCLRVQSPSPSFALIAPILGVPMKIFIQSANTAESAADDHFLLILALPSRGTALPCRPLSPSAFLIPPLYLIPLALQCGDRRSHRPRKQAALKQTGIPGRASSSVQHVQEKECIMKPLPVQEIGLG